jgi:hypothetical protein
MRFIYMLLLLLAVSIVFEALGKKTVPDEERHVRDKRGRWWRQNADGSWEEALRRPKKRN